MEIISHKLKSFHFLEHSAELKKKYLDNIKISLSNESISIIEKYHTRAKMIYIKNNSKYESYHQELDNWFYTTYFYFSILENNFITFKCIETNILLNSCYSSFFIWGIDNGKIIYYYFSNDENSFVLFFGGTYNLPIGIYYLKTCIFYSLCYASFGGIYNNPELIEHLVINFQKNFNEKNIDINNKIKKQNIFFFGNNFQMGHHIWNEVSGIDILIKSGMIKNIDILVVGDWDIYNFHKIIKKENPSCSILFHKDFIESINNNQSNNIYCQIGDGFILNETKILISENIQHIETPSEKFKLLINLKLDRRQLENTLFIYTKLINSLIENNIINPKDLYLIFDGFYLNDNEISRNYYNSICDKYINGVKYITENIDKNIEIVSLIGEKTDEISKYYKICDYFIGSDGSNVDILKWIFSKDGCIFTHNEYIILKYLNNFYVEDIKDYNVLLGPIINEQNDFRIDFEVIYKEVSVYLQKKYIK